MTQSIYMSELEIKGEQTVFVPEGAEFLTVQLRYGIPCLWALIKTDRPMESRKILIRGTGHDAEGVGRYIGTFQNVECYKNTVFHVFEGTEENYT